MHSRRTARAAVISTIFLALAAVAGPAVAGHDEPDGSYSSEEDGSEDYGSDERAGRSPEIDLQVGCDSVDATAPRKISTVTVYFVDGTEEIIEVDEREYSGTFDTTIDHAVAESRKEMAVDHAQDCEPEPSASPSESAPEDGSDGTADGPNEADTQTEDTSTRTASSSGDGAGTRTRSASTSDSSSTSSTTAASSSTAPAVPSTGAPSVGSPLSVGGNAHVLGMVLHQGLKTCPSGPHKGMPYLKLSDCGDLVLGVRLSATGSGAGWFALGGFGLIGLGALLLRLRRPSVAA